MSKPEVDVQNMTKMCPVFGHLTKMWPNNFQSLDKCPKCDQKSVWNLDTWPKCDQDVSRIWTLDQKCDQDVSRIWTLVQIEKLEVSNVWTQFGHFHSQSKDPRILCPNFVLGFWNFFWPHFGQVSKFWTFFLPHFGQLSEFWMLIWSHFGQVS